MQQERADASFKRKEVQAREATKAMADYQAATAAERAKTERLRALRLAKEAADLEAAAKAPPPPVKVAKVAKPKVAAAKAPAKAKAAAAKAPAKPKAAAKKKK